MYYNLIICSKEKPIINKNYDYIWINEDFMFLEEGKIKTLDSLYEYEYLIYTNKINADTSNIQILKENEVPVTNFFYQTSIETIYFITEDNFNEKLNDILENE